VLRSLSKKDITKRGGGIHKGLMVLRGEVDKRLETFPVRYKERKWRASERSMGGGGLDRKSSRERNIAQQGDRIAEHLHERRKDIRKRQTGKGDQKGGRIG